MDTLGIYISFPFCKAKCTFCNFASDTFALSRMDAYAARLAQEIAEARNRAVLLGEALPEEVDTLYLGGGTPSLLEPGHIRSLFAALREHFRLAPEAEMTLECAPGQLAEGALAEWLRQGLNRVSLGVQSFVDRESAAVGRLHTRETCLAEMARLRAAGLPNLSLDLIAGLPHQTEASWRESVEQAIATRAPHVSVYMLEVDEDSRLGREAIGHGSRYGAGQLPSEDESAAFYQQACGMLGDAGIGQYEISNFARPGFASRHNLKYWQREPYLGFGLDAHSMLGEVRFANTDDLDSYLTPSPFATQLKPDILTPEAVFEESLFLGLRLNGGVALHTLDPTLLAEVGPSLEELREAGLVQMTAGRVALTDAGRLLSNEVFSRILLSTLA